MNLKDLLSISGMPGLYKLLANRPNGLMVEGLHDKKRKFVSSRKHQFTPLESIAIYTNVDSTSLTTIFKTMHQKLGSLPLPDKKASSNVLAEYFKEILPDYDTFRVYPKDIQKVIKWFGVLNEHGLISSSDEEE